MKYVNIDHLITFIILLLVDEIMIQYIGKVARHLLEEYKIIYLKLVYIQVIRDLSMNYFVYKTTASKNSFIVTVWNLEILAFLIYLMDH